MEMALLKLFTSFLLLLLQLVPTTKSVSPKHEIIPADPQLSKNAEINVIKEEMDAVGDNISALYIVRKINERAKALKVSKSNAIEKMQALHGHPSKKIKALEEELAKAENVLTQARSTKPIEVDVDGPADQQVPQVVENANSRNKLARRKAAVDELNKKLTDAKKSREIDKKLFLFWTGKLNESKLPYKEIDKLNEQLAGALKEEQKMENYLNEVNAHVDIFRKKKEIAKKEEEKHPGMDEYQICHKLCAEHLDFLEQIRLEVQLHHEFKLKPEVEPHHHSKNSDLRASSVFSDFQAFMENAQNFEKFNGKAKKTNRRKMLDCVVPANHPKKVILENGEFASNLQLNNAVKNLYMEMLAVIEWPFKNEEKFVGSIADVVKAANVEKERCEKDLYKIDPNDLKQMGGLMAKNYLENLFNMCDTVHSILPKLPFEWQRELHGKIHDKVEMPREWYEKMHAEAYPNILGEYEPTEEVVHLRIKVLLAKTLLVYERLKKFYRIDVHYNVWKRNQIPVNLPKEMIEEILQGYPLLKPYFDQFHKNKPAAVASPTVHGHDQHASTSLHG